MSGRRSSGGSWRRWRCRFRALPAVSWFLLVLPACMMPVEREGVQERGIPGLYREVREGEREEVQVLYPFARLVREPGLRDLAVLPLFWDKVVTDEGGRYDRDWGVMPFFLGGQDDEDGGYFLFFPLWGNTKELLGKDEMRFRLFPLYMDAREGDYESVHVLWPLVCAGEGEDRRDFRFLPFYSMKEEAGKSWSRSVLWPFLSWGEEALDTEDPVTSFFAFPFYGRVDSRAAWSRAWLYPFFTFAGSADGSSETNLFWPVYRRMETADGSRSAFRLWPFYGHSRTEASEEEFVLWPIFWDTRLELGDGTVKSFQVVPLLRRSEYLALDGSSRGEELQVWPLFKRRVAEDGEVRFRALAPIPFTDWEEFEANLGWAFTLLSVASGEERERVDLLSGLLGWESDPEGSALRLLWFLEIPL